MQKHMHFTSVKLIESERTGTEDNENDNEMMMHKSFNQLFKEYFKPVKSFVKKLVKSDIEAEDIAQEVFAQLWAKPEIWSGNPDVDRYIYRMAKYQALTFLRNYARKYDCGLTDADMSQVEAVKSDIDTIDPIIHDEAQLILAMALEKMPPKRREIFSMSRFEGLSNKEIAEKLGLSVRTVESHIYSALADLKALFPQ